MTGNPQITTEDSNIAEIEDAVRANTQIICEAETKTAVAETEQKNIYAQGEGAPSGASSPTPGAEDARCSVGLDVAMDASGVGGAAQACKMLGEAIKDYSDPFKHGSARTFDKVIKDGAAGKTAGNIFTGPFNEKAALPGRAKGINSFLNGEDKVKGVAASETKSAALANTVQQTKSLGLVSKLHAGNALANKGKVLAKEQTAQLNSAPGMGLGGGQAAKLLHEKHLKPNSDLGKDIVVTDTTESWVT